MSSIEVTPLPNVTLVRRERLANAPELIVAICLGMIIWVKELQI